MLLKKELFVRNLLKTFGVVALVAAIGLTMAACDLPKDDLDGTTWKRGPSGILGISTVLKFDSPNFTMTYTLTETKITVRGTYSISGRTVNLFFENGDELTGTLSGNTLTFGLEIYTKQ